VRLFEAAGCGSAIISDEWPGLETFFTPGEEILFARESADVVSYLDGIDAAEARRIGQRAQERVLAEHTSERRAREFEMAVGAKAAPLAAQHS
jgi:spore maturation protein CgeB